MYISRIALDSFRSWNHLICDCKPGINIIYGNNGLGKTNIVESLEVASTGISHRTSSTLPLITRGFTTSTIQINVCNNSNKSVENSKEKTYEITLSLKGANRARIDGGKSLYMRDIVGFLPIVSFTPRDQSLIVGDPSIRRTFIDKVGSLLIKDYAQLLQEFIHIAKQRTALLKSIRESSYNNQNISLSGLEIWTGKFIESGINLTKARQKAINILNKYFTNILKNLTNNQEFAELKYVPSFEEILLCNNNSEENNQLLSLLSKHFQRIYEGELARGCNLIGPHRDDVDFILNSMPAREFASNGESWILAVAAKMSLCKALEEKNNSKPIVILDDVFAQLDEYRRKQILQFSLQQGQVFITASSLNDIPNNIDINQKNLINIQDIAEEQKSINKIDEEHSNILKDILLNRNGEQEETL